MFSGERRDIMKTRWGVALLLLFMIAAMTIYRQVHDRSKVENLYTDGRFAWNYKPFNLSQNP